MKTVVVVGTRPAAIKLAPVIHALRSQTSWQVTVCATGQHEEMLSTALNAFGLDVDTNLELMRPDQEVYELSSAVVASLGKYFSLHRPELVLVQGDTISTLGASLAAFFTNCKIGHVEAGLRTDDLLSPWPEEANRRLTTQLATWHFAPTENARSNLRREAVPAESIFVTGNTVVDALAWILKRRGTELVAALHDRLPFLAGSRRVILATMHRRENQGPGLVNVCLALQELAQRGDTSILLPLHPNPASRSVVSEVLGDVENVHLVEPLSYCDFVAAMKLSDIIISDSGGVQEEAPYLGVPVLVARDKTERPEAIECGTARLVGTDTATILRHAHELLDDKVCYQQMAGAKSPFGDGNAAIRIVDVLLDAQRLASS